jgi:hypothetical protein
MPLFAWRTGLQPKSSSQVWQRKGEQRAPCKLFAPAEGDLIHNITSAVTAAASVAFERISVAVVIPRRPSPKGSP